MGRFDDADAAAAADLVNQSYTGMDDDDVGDALQATPL